MNALEVGRSLAKAQEDKLLAPSLNNASFSVATCENMTAEACTYSVFLSLFAALISRVRMVPRHYRGGSVGGMTTGKWIAMHSNSNTIANNRKSLSGRVIDVDMKQSQSLSANTPPCSPLDADVTNSSRLPSSKEYSDGSSRPKLSSVKSSRNSLSFNTLDGNGYLGDSSRDHSTSPLTRERTRSLPDVEVASIAIDTIYDVKRVGSANDRIVETAQSTLSSSESTTATSYDLTSLHTNGSSKSSSSPMSPLINRLDMQRLLAGDDSNSSGSPEVSPRKISDDDSVALLNYATMDMNSSRSNGSSTKHSSWKFTQKLPLSMVLSSNESSNGVLQRDKMKLPSPTTANITIRNRSASGPNLSFGVEFSRMLEDVREEGLMVARAGLEVSFLPYFFKYFHY